MKQHAKAVLFVLGILGLIVVPYLIWGEQISRFAEQTLESPASRRVVMLVCVALLALDVVLPVPSSLVSTAAGYLLGFWGGVTASSLGMTLGCALGYLIGDRLGAPVASRIIDARDFALISDRLRSAPFVWLVVLRPVPVLAEASCIVAGTVRVGAAGFMGWTLVANVAISVIYSAAGSKYLGATPALAVAVGLPALTMLAARLFNARRH